MAKTLKGYLNKIASLDDRIDSQVDNILKVIDIDEVQKNPQIYMQELGKQFFECLNVLKKNCLRMVL